MRNSSSFFLFPVVLCLAACGTKSAEQSEKPVVIDILSVRPLEAAPPPPEFGTWEYASGVPLTFKVSGKLEQGTTPLKAGDKFHKGQLLFQINNREAYRQYSQLKRQLLTRFREFLPDVRQSFPGEIKKWEAFITALEKPELLPTFPTFATEQEASLFDYLKRDYQSLIQLETNMPDYFVLAPFDGIVLETATPIGTTIRSGQTVAYIGRTKELVASIVTSGQTTPDSLVSLFGAGVNTAVRAKLQSVRQQSDGTQILQYKPLDKVNKKKGEEIRITPLHSPSDERFMLPKSAIRNKHVCIVLPNGKTELTTVRIHKIQGDSVSVSGLNAGNHIVASYRTTLPAKRTLRIVP